MAAFEVFGVDVLEIILLCGEILDAEATGEGFLGRPNLPVVCDVFSLVRYAVASQMIDHIVSPLEGRDCSVRIPTHGIVGFEMLVAWMKYTAIATSDAKLCLYVFFVGLTDIVEAVLLFVLLAIIAIFVLSAASGAPIKVIILFCSRRR